MRKLLSFLTVIFVLSGLVFGGVITVTSPTGGTFCPGDQITINWNEVPQESQQMKIRLWNSTMTAKIMNITATAIPNNGTYPWTIPAGIPQGQYTILVRSSVDLQIQGFSAVFTINTCTPPQGSINVAKPANVAQGNNCPISWTSTGTVGSAVHVMLFNQAGTAQVYLIVNNTSNDGSHTWPVPGSIQNGTYRIKVENLDGTVNGMSGTFYIGPAITLRPEERQAYFIPKPDLVIGGDMRRTPKHPKVDEFFDFKFRVDNIGNGQAIESNAELTIKGPENFLLVKKISIRSLGSPPDHEYIKKRMRLPRMGIYRFTVKLDADNNVSEGNESNNEKWILVDVNPKQFPDLKITNVSTPDYKKTIQQKCKMSVTITNIGKVHSGYFELDANLDTCPLIAQGRKYRTHQGLAPGESVTFTFEHRYACFKMVGVGFYVDKANKVQESNENNNTCGLPFHISGDNIVGKKAPWSSSCGNNLP